ncbi:MAG: transferrin-binding protein-like solute binding protein [Alphaproteobacteria bacterium]|nr:transferrin-binding protein-like solute binding protein [Alphaproteobacteria bacterium]
MREPFILVILLLLLVACSSGNSDGSVSHIDVNSSNNDNTDNNTLDDKGDDNNATLPTFDTSKRITLNSVNTITNSKSQDTDIPTYKDGGNDVAYDSLTAISDAAGTGKIVQKTTLQGLAVQGNETSMYKREATTTLWGDTANLNINRQIQISRIDLSFVTLNFDNKGNISGVSTYLDGTPYTITGNATDKNNFSVTKKYLGIYDVSINVKRGKDFFGFDSNYMAYNDWKLEKNRLSDTLEDEKFAINGMVIVGIETEDANIPTLNKVNFTGKGGGIYGSLDAHNALTEYTTIFDIKADVDFATRRLEINISDTKCTDACENINVPTYLNFALSGVSFANEKNDAASNKMSHAVNIDTNLTGTLDARFYGSAAQEFGGTFALAEASKRYYYGAFGAYDPSSRKTSSSPPVEEETPPVVEETPPVDEETPPVEEETPPFDTSKIMTLNAVDTVTNSNPQNTNIPTYNDDGNDVAYDSLTAISDAAATDNTVKQVTLQGLAVQVNDSSSYKRETVDTLWSDEANLNINREIQISHIVSSFVTLDFDEHGNISGVSSYLNDLPYTATGDGTDKNSFTATNFGVLVNVKRGENFFGFDSDYMAYIDWNLGEQPLSDSLIEDNKFAINGMMIAGIETDINDFPATQNDVTFMGAGKGVYGVLDVNNLLARYHTSFTATATANFSTRTVTLTTSATNCISDNCSGDLDLSILDFTASGLSFVNDDNSTAVNNISAEITANESLTGTLDARFYGSAAQEFGGTFSLAEVSKRYYYGAFGVKEILPEIPPSPPFDTSKIITLNEVNMIANSNLQDTNIPTYRYDGNDIEYNSLNVIASAADTDNTVKQVTLQGLAVQESEHSIYKRETADTSWSDEANLNVNRQIQISRITLSAVTLTFDADGNISAVTAYAHADEDAEYSTGDDNLTINADRSGNFFGFGTDYMAYISWHLAKPKTELGDGIEDNLYHRTGMMIVGIETASDGFPTTQNDVTFMGAGKGVYGALDENNMLSHYHTSFTATATANFFIRTVTLTTSATNCISDNCSGDLDLSILDFTASGLSFANDDNSTAVNNISAEITANESLIGTLDARFYGKAAQEFGGTFSLIEASKRYYYGAFGAYDTTTPRETPLRAALTAPEYHHHPSRTINSSTKRIKEIIIIHNNKAFTSTIEEKYFGTSDLFDGNNYDESLSAYISISKSDAFSFTPKYMAHIGWNMQQIISYDVANNIVHPDESVRQEVERQNGNMIEGYHTPYNKIFPASRGTINFTGEGKGLYIMNKQIVDYQDYDTSFDVNAAIDFSKREMNLKVSNTVACRKNAGNVNCTTDASGLNFIKKLSYGAYDNYASGSISLSGMSGTVNANFFGPKSEELGGTFYTNGTNNGDSYEYSAYFGARRDWIYKHPDGSVSEQYDYAPLFTNEDEPQAGDVVLVSTSFNNASSEANRTNNHITVTSEDALMVERKKSTGGISLNHQALPAIRIAFDDEGRITAAGVYFDNSNTKKYRSKRGSSFQSTSKMLETTVIAGYGTIYTNKKIRVSRSATYSDFGDNHTNIDAEYMAVVEWTVRKGSNSVGGIGLAGFETDINDASLPNAGIIQFNGVSNGYYESNAQGLFKTQSLIRANVDLSTKNVTISSTATQCEDYAQCALSGVNANGLNFDATLNYQGSNDMIANVQSQFNTVSGTIQARFYGPNAEELGGVFGMKNANGSKTYYGHFLTKR